MVIHIYYGGRGVIDDPTRPVIERMQKVLEELRVNVVLYNLYEFKNTIPTLSQTIKDADGIVLASTVEWFGMGGYMLEFLDSVWQFGDKSRIGEIYMMPIVIAKTYGERQVLADLSNAWETLGGKVLTGLSGYIGKSSRPAASGYRRFPLPGTRRTGTSSLRSSGTHTTGSLPGRQSQSAGKSSAETWETAVETGRESTPMLNPSAHNRTRKLLPQYSGRRSGCSAPPRSAPQSASRPAGPFPAFLLPAAGQNTENTLQLPFSGQSSPEYDTAGIPLPRPAASPRNIHNTYLHINS